MSWRAASGSLCAIATLSALGAATSAHAWREDVAHAISDTCAVRGLDLQIPLTVLPMADFQGGYTPGIGSVTWEADHARLWREGWCAVGVYCADRPGIPASNVSDGNGNGRLDQPAGLYDPERNVLFVRDLGSTDAVATIAHEAVHALQHQNFPALRAIHLWRNRDLAAAANSAIEGDAHVVGWSFDPARQTLLCSMDPASATENHARWWRWRPDALSALEAFPHVFGTEYALREMLLHGHTAMDRALREPPLATLGVLKPALADMDIDFIRLPEQLTVDGCTAGLRNTLGVVGIWGLLRQHGDADASSESLPAFLEGWRGDRFAHVACPGDRDDELAWLTRWQTPDAAAAFAERYRAIADALPPFGGVLGSVPEPVVAGRAVIVVTPGLRHAVARIADAEVKPLSKFSQWVDTGCFPDRTCEDSTVHQTTANGIWCTPPAEPPGQLGSLLDRIRRARSVRLPTGTKRATAQDNAVELAAFCAVNNSGNADFMAACRATYTGAHYVAQLTEDPNYRLLPFCLNEREVRGWVRATYYPDETFAFADEANFIRIFGFGRAAAVFGTTGFDGLRELTAAPPLSTLALLRPANHDVDLIGLRAGEFHGHGCEVTANQVRGALAIWRLLGDYELVPRNDVLPSFLAEWRGDHLLHVRCSRDEQAGWAWISRWRTADAASTFAEHYRQLPPVALAEMELPDAIPVIDEQTVWVVPPALEHIEPALRTGIDVRKYADFASWVAGGCFPQQSCNERPSLAQPEPSRRQRAPDRDGR